MYNLAELSKLITAGMRGDTEAAVKACRIIDAENFLFTGWPEKPDQIPAVKVYPSRPGDKGKKMTAKFSKGQCSVCNQDILESQEIYYRRESGSTHVACVDVPVAAV